jgi:hypothetical protein
MASDGYFQSVTVSRDENGRVLPGSTLNGEGRNQYKGNAERLSAEARALLDRVLGGRLDALRPPAAGRSAAAHPQLKHAAARGPSDAAALMMRSC